MNFSQAANMAAKAMSKLSQVFLTAFRYKRSHRRGKWTMMAKCGRNKNERLRDQIMLRGRGKKKRS